MCRSAYPIPRPARPRGSAAFWAAWLLSLAAVSAQESGTIRAVFRCDRDSPFRNEVFPVVLEITTTGADIAPEMGLRSLPPPDQFVFTPFEELEPERQSHPGGLVSIRRFRSRVRATTPGPLTLAPVLEYRLVYRRRVLFGTEQVEQPGTSAVQPLTLVVRDWPEAGKPAVLSGAVGQFRFSRTVEPADVVTGELVTVRYTVQGTGYMERIEVPAITQLPGFRVYPLRPVTEEPNRRIYEQILVPGSTTATAIPPATLSFLDPIAGTYRSLQLPAATLRYHAAREVVRDVYRPTTPPAAGTVLLAVPTVRGLPWYNFLVGAAAIMAFAIGVSYARRNWRRALLWSVAGILVTGGTWILRTRVWQPFHITCEAEARLAPADTARVLFRVHPGDTARPREYSGTWVRIETPSGGGWVPGSCLTNSPAAPGKP